MKDEQILMWLGRESGPIAMMWLALHPSLEKKREETFLSSTENAGSGISPCESLV